MKKNGFVNNRLRMNFMIRKNCKSKTPTKNSKIQINKKDSSRRYLDLYQNEISTQKNLLTPDINKKSIKKKPIFEPQHNTLETDFLNFLTDDNEEINNNINLFSNSFDISRSLVNIEDYMNLYYNSKNKNPFLNKFNNSEEKESNKKIENEKIITKYSYKNKNWVLIEKLDDKDKVIDIIWKEIADENIIKESKNELKDLNLIEENYNSLKLEYNKLKQIFNDLNNKYENINKKNKEFQIKLNYYFHKMKEVEKEKEKYIKKNQKLKEEIHKIPSLIEQEMNKFREEAQKNISKKIYELEQENKILKGEKFIFNNKDEVNILDSCDLKINGNNESLNFRNQKNIF